VLSGSSYTRETVGLMCFSHTYTSNCGLNKQLLYLYLHLWAQQAAALPTCQFVGSKVLYVCVNLWAQQAAPLPAC
jgi:hypothetical protein